MLGDMDKYRGIPLFWGIPEHRICPLLQAIGAHGREYKKGKKLISAGETTGAIGVILSGSVHMLKYDVWGRKTLIAYMSRGDLFGESFAVRQEKSSYTFFLRQPQIQRLSLSVLSRLYMTAAAMRNITGC